VAHTVQERKVYMLFVRKTEGKRPLGRPRRRWGRGSECVSGKLAGLWSLFSWWLGLCDMDLVGSG
jgi:hypothetical protein